MLPEDLAKTDSMYMTMYEIKMYAKFCNKRVFVSWIFVTLHFTVSFSCRE